MEGDAIYQEYQDTPDMTDLGGAWKPPWELPPSPPLMQNPMDLLKNLKDTFTTSPPGMSDIQQLNSILGGRSYTGGYAPGFDPNDRLKQRLNTIMPIINQMMGQFGGTGQTGGADAVTAQLQKILQSVMGGITPQIGGIQEQISKLGQGNVAQIQQILQQALQTIQPSAATMQSIADPFKQALDRIQGTQGQIGQTISDAMGKLQTQAAAPLPGFGNSMQDILNQLDIRNQAQQRQIGNAAAGQGRSQLATPVQYAGSLATAQNQRNAVQSAASLEQMRAQIQAQLTQQLMQGETGLTGNLVSALQGLSGQGAQLGAGLGNAMAGMAQSTQGAQAGLLGGAGNNLARILEQTQQEQAGIAQLPLTLQQDLAKGILPSLVNANITIPQEEQARIIQTIIQQVLGGAFNA